MKRFLMLIAAGLMLAACGSSSEPIVRTVFAQPVIPAVAKVPCAAPQVLPERSLSEAEVTRFWGRDRTNLKQCEVKRQAAVGAQ